MIMLFNKDTGAPLGAVSEADLQVLVDQLRQGLAGAEGIEVSWKRD